VPAQLKERYWHLLKRVDKGLSFGELATNIDGPFAEEWATIGQALQQLDSNVKPNPSSTIPDSGHPNYQDRVDLMGSRRCAVSAARRSWWVSRAEKLR